MAFGLDLDSIKDTVTDVVGDKINLESLDFSKLLNSDFLSKYSNFGTLKELFTKHDIPLDKEKLLSYPEEKLDEIISKDTKFSTWKDMLMTAVKELF